MLLTFTHTNPNFYVSSVHVLENIVGKREIARKEQFLLRSQRIKNFLPFSLNLKLSSAKSLILEEAKICSFGKGLNIENSGEQNKERSKTMVGGYKPVLLR